DARPLLDRPAAAADPLAAILVCLDFGDPAFGQDVEEVVRLVESAGVTRHQLVRGRRSRPDPKFYAGVGKVGEIARAAAELNAMHVVFNHELSAAQERNLERELQRRVMDRTELILEIFAQRAQTTEGKLQVELARLEHLSTRLVRGWTHLERQRGGLGKTGGPGETQLELERRYIARRVRILKEKREGLKNRRQLQRRARVRRAEQAAEVDKVLGEIGADAVPRIAVWNKIDCAHLEPAVERDQYGKISRVLVSARTGAGLEGLRGAIAEFARDRATARGAAPSEP